MQFLKKYGKLILLFVLFLIVMEGTLILNRIIDDRLERQETTETLKRLQQTVDESDAAKKGLNEYQVIWDYELKMLREEYPEDNGILFEYIDKETWNSEIDQLADSINTAYVSSEDILSTIKDIIPDRFEDEVFEDYFLSMAILQPELFK